VDKGAIANRSTPSDARMLRSKGLPLSAIAVSTGNLVEVQRTPRIIPVARYLLAPP